MITPKEDKIITDKALNDGGPFYERFTIHPNDNRRYDAVVLKLTNGRAVTATLKSDEKFGVVIDGTFYDDNMLQELSKEKIASLTFGHPSFDIPMQREALYNFKTK